MRSATCQYAVNRKHLHPWCHYLSGWYEWDRGCPHKSTSFITFQYDDQAGWRLRHFLKYMAIAAEYMTKVMSSLMVNIFHSVKCNIAKIRNGRNERNVCNVIVVSFSHITPMNTWPCQCSLLQEYVTYNIETMIISRTGPLMGLLPRHQLVGA